MKKFICLVLCLLLVGCSNTYKKEDSRTETLGTWESEKAGRARSEETGCDDCIIEKQDTAMVEFNQTTMQEANDKIRNGDTFVLFLHFNTCPWCIDAKPVLYEVFKDNLDILYAVDVRPVGDGPEFDIRKIEGQEDWANFISLNPQLTNELDKITVPITIVYKDGKMISYFTNMDYKANEDEILTDELRSQLVKEYEKQLEEVLD